VWKEVVVAYPEAVSKHLPEMIDESDMKQDVRCLGRIFRLGAMEDFLN
jgi:hypothetical protein